MIVLSDSSREGGDAGVWLCDGVLPVARKFQVPAPASKKKG